MGQALSSADAYKCASSTAPQDKPSGGGGGAQVDRASREKWSKMESDQKRAQQEAPSPAFHHHDQDRDHLEHVRKLSIVSNRNIQLLSMKPRSERDNYADGLRSRRRSSLINMILGAPSSGPRFSDDLCSLSSHMSDLCQNFGIDYFPDTAAGAGWPRTNHAADTNSTITASSAMRLEDGNHAGYCTGFGSPNERTLAVDRRCLGHRRRRSSLGSLTSLDTSDCASRQAHSRFATTTANATKSPMSPVNETQPSSPETRQAARNELATDAHAGVPCEEESAQAPQQSSASQSGAEARHSFRRCPSLSSIFLASIDLTSSLEDATNEEHSLPAHADGGQQTGLDGLAQNNRGSSVIKQAAAARNQASNESAHSSRGTPPPPWRFSSVPDKRRTTNEGSSSERVSGADEVGRWERINQETTRRMLHRSGSELSLYSGGSAGCSSLSHHQLFHHKHQLHQCSLPICPSWSASAAFLGKRDARLSSGTSSLIGDGCCGRVGGRSLGSGSSFGEPAGTKRAAAAAAARNQNAEQARETKLIIMLQVCLPFILAGFGNMAAGLVLNKVAQWKSFQHVPIFFVLLPSFIGLKGNIEMTLASRLSTLANLNLLATRYQRRNAYISNLILILSQAIGLSLFAAGASMLCEFFMGKLEFSLSHTFYVTSLVVLPCALLTSIVLVFISSIVMWWSIWLANLIRVNPDNLSTLLAAMYGDVSCVLTYGLFAEIMYSLHQQEVLIWPLLIICVAVASWPILWYVAFKFRETHELSVSSMPPMMSAIVVSLGSGTVLSLVVGRFTRIALYQPVVNGFGANLIAVQASRVSTWLWCTALRRLSTATPEPPSTVTKSTTKLDASLVPLASFPCKQMMENTKEPKYKFRLHRQLASKLALVGNLALKVIKMLLWSFVNSSPNSVAARLLLIMLIPAHTLYFFVIWLLSPANYVLLTWPFYAIYILLCLTQVFVLLLICEPLMTLLMRRHLDPEIFGISLLMALADLVGTLCLTGAFLFLARIGDPNAF